MNAWQRLSTQFYGYNIIEKTDDYEIIKQTLFDNKQNKFKDYKVKYYKNINFKHRFEGPAVYIYDLESDDILDVHFFHNNKKVPDWVLKISEFGLSHNLNNKEILKISLKYDIDYALFLKKYYEESNELIKTAKNIFKEAILDLIKFKNISDVDSFCEEIYTLFNLKNYSTFDVAKKIIKETILGMAIDNIIEYNEEGNFIKIKQEKENGIQTT